MAEITKATDASMDGSNPAHPQIAGDLFAGEDLAACDLCYISAADGKVYRSTGAAANAAAAHPRLCPIAVKSGRPVTLFCTNIRWKAAAAAGLTPGAILYVSGTVPGGLADAASTGDAVGTAQAVSDTDVVLIRP